MFKENDMKTTDLRIGNLIGIKETALHADGCNHSEAIFEIEEIKNDVVQFKGYHANEYYKDLKPIPLTEQWLLDFGFNQSIEGQWYVHFNEMCLTLYEDLPQYIVEIHDMEMDKSSIFLMSIKYVHQLQNLYFALAQEELILKERSKE